MPLTVLFLSSQHFQASIFARISLANLYFTCLIFACSYLRDEILVIGWQSTPSARHLIDTTAQDFTSLLCLP